ncbi:MAG TPA: hypothetical protein VJN71_11020 [Nitrososphaerales archaeon]|nr:hypothetical protein [Nitrososphaerales archaeon]
MLGLMVKMNPIGIGFGLFLVIFLASFAEFGILAATNTIPSGELFVGAQLIISILVMMLFAALAIFRDI